MIRLIKIEWQKLKAMRAFRILMALTLIAFILVPFGGEMALQWIENNVDDIMSELPINPTQLPIFDFVDIWQNLAWVYKKLTILLSFVVIISVTNDFEYKTARQNIIDGLSRKEFWWSKLLFILAISVGASLLFLVIGLVLGFWMSPVTAPEYILRHIEFVGAYFLQVLSVLMFSFAVSILIRRSGFAIALVILWNYVVESVVFVANGIMFHEEVMGSMWLSNLMPLEAASNVIPNPLPRYILMKTPETIPFDSLGIAMVWLVLYFVFTYYRINRRDF